MTIQINQTTPLETITEQVIGDLLQHDADEDIYFDFKEGLDDTHDRAKCAIRKAFASFANTFGGFLFFGILDKGNAQGKHGLDRLVGVSATEELGRLITQKYLDRGYCIPVIDFEGPRVIKVAGKQIAVVKVLASDKRPHAIRQALDRPLEFWARGAGTARPMDYSHLLLEIDRSREARGWLIALWLNLSSIIAVAGDNVTFNGRMDVLPHRFDSIIFHELGNLMRTLGSDITLMKRLLPLKEQLTLANDAREHHNDRPIQPLLTRDQIIVQMNVDLASRSRQVKEAAIEITDYLAENYAQVREIIALSQSIPLATRTHS